MSISKALYLTPFARYRAVLITIAFERQECAFLTNSFRETSENIIKVIHCTAKTIDSLTTFLLQTLQCGSTFNHVDLTGRKADEFGRITRNYGYYAVKIIQGHLFSYQSNPICDFLINTSILSRNVSKSVKTMLFGNFWHARLYYCQEGLKHGDWSDGTTR